MWSWWIKSLESDEWLDFIEMLDVYKISNEIWSNETLKEFSLEKIIDFLIFNWFLWEKADNISYLFDNTLICLSEIYTDFRKNNFLDYEYFENIEKFSSDKKSLEYLLKWLEDIKNQVPDKDWIREIFKLKSWNPEWLKHIDNLIFEIKKEL